MSVTGPGANISAIQRLSELELQTGAIGESSWHNRYKDSCYIYIGGLDKRMTEGDIIIVFSQFGEPIDINLKRNNKTGESLGYCFLGYKDQRSTILAVDNFNGSTLLGRRIRVDHVLDYKAPIVYEDECDEDGNKIRKEYKPTGAEGSGIDKFYVTESEAMLKETTKKVPKEEPEMDEDERWALEFERSLKNDRDRSPNKDKHHSIDTRTSRDRRSYNRHSRDRYGSRHRRDHRRYSHDRHRSHSRRRSNSRSRRRSRDRYRSHERHSRDRHRRDKKERRRLHSRS